MNSSYLISKITEEQKTCSQNTLRPGQCDLAQSRKEVGAALPPFFRSGWALLLIGLLPQLILAAWNWQAWVLVRSELNTAQMWKWATLGLAQLGLLGVITYAAIVAIRYRVQVGTRMTCILTIVPSLYLSTTAFWTLFGFGWASELIPASLSRWMLPEQTFLYHQFLWMMPITLYGVMRFVCRENAKAKILLPLVQGIGVIFGLAGLLFISATGLSRVVSSFAPEALVMIPVVAVSIILSLYCVACLLRSCISGYLSARRRGPFALALVGLLTGVALPLLGLFVNQAFPFPYSFQTREIYVLAICTGLAVSLPYFAHPWAHRLVWGLQALTLPFSVYFFLVFLPVLPLLAPGVFVIGAGLLIAVPSLLLFLHLHRLVDAWRQEVRENNRYAVAIMFIALALCWPGIHLAQVYRDRAELRAALDYISYPDLTRPARFSGDPAKVEKCLQRLVDFKAGIYLPLISDAYNAVVFGGRVLPQAKLDALARVITGKPAPPPSEQKTFSATDRGFHRTVEEQLTQPIGERFKAAARISSMSTSRIAAGTAATKTVIKLTVHNSTAESAEYIGRISLPRGAFITNLWLHIAGERLAGQIFEAESVFWVYQKETERLPVPRDPAILRYTSEREVELRVFPVPPEGERIVEFEILHASTGTVVIDDSNIALRSAHLEDTAVITESPDGAIFFSSGHRLKMLDGHLRTPVLKFFVDWSLNAAEYEAAQLLEMVEATAREWPTAKSFEIIAIGLDSATLAQGPLNRAEALIRDGLRNFRLPRRGGFDANRAVRWAIVSQALSAEHANASTFPLISLVSRWHRCVELPGNLSSLASLMPDVDGYRLLDVNANEIQYKSWCGESLERLKQREVVVLRHGGRIAAAARENDAPLMAIFVHSADSAQPAESLCRQGQFLPIPGASFVGAEEPLAVASAVWLKDLDRKLFPDRNKGTLPELVAAAREAGVLTPSASYVVFETAAQWEMARRMEKKKLSDHEALPIAAVPEPSIYLLLGAGGLFIFLQQNGARVRRLLRLEWRAKRFDQG